MIPINDKIAGYLLKFNGKMADYIGYFCEQGAVIGDAKLVVVSLDGKTYLAHIDEFEQEGVLIRLKDESKQKRKRTVKKI
jgi:hypothetical protein